MNYIDTNDFLRWNKPNVFILNKQKAKKLSPQLISSKYIVQFITTTLLLINCLICNFDVKADIVYGRNENGGNTAIVNKDGYEGNVDPTIIKIKE